MVDLAIYKKNVECYIFSVNLLKTMQNKGILDKNDFNIAEKSIAKKYGIKTTSIYRLYGLNT